MTDDDLFASDFDRSCFLTWHAATYGEVDPETVAERVAEYRRELEVIG